MNDRELGKQHAKDWLKDNSGRIVRSYPGLLHAAIVLMISNQEVYLSENDRQRFNEYSNGWHEVILTPLRETNGKI